MSPHPQPTAFALPLPSLTETTPDLAGSLAPRDLDPRQASVVTQIITASTGISAPTSGSSTSSSGGGFPVAVAVPALIGGMAIAILGALGWWYYQRRKTRERKRRWEARQKRQQRKRDRANSVATSRPSFSGGARPATSRMTTTGGMSEKEKDLGLGTPPVPPMPTVSKEYGFDHQQQQQQPVHNGGYSYSADTYGRQQSQQQQQEYDQYSQYPVQPEIDAYGASANSNEAGANGNPFASANEAESQPYIEEYKPNGPTPPPVPGPKSSSRGAKRVEAAENAAAREQADPMTRWRPNKPSPLALAAAEKKAAAAAAASSTLSPNPNSLSPSRTKTTYTSRTSVEAARTNSSADSNWEYQEELTTPHDPDYTSRRSTEMGRGAGGTGARQVSGEWGVAGGISGGASAESHYPMRQSEDGGAYSNDPYLSSNAGAGGGDGYRLPSGQYTVDPYAGYHGNGNGGEQGKGKAEISPKKGKVGGWV